MIEANELRIGNYYMFADYDGIVYRAVQEIKHNQFGLYSDCDGVNFEICRPIPLTEEWLIKLGFEKDEEIGYRWYIEWENCIIIAYDLDDKCIRVSDTWEFGRREYVHQLQNLYFALTQKELTI